MTQNESLNVGQVGSDREVQEKFASGISASKEAQ